MDPLSQPFSKDKTPFPLSVIPENGCSPGGAIDHLENIDQMSMPDSFLENDITPMIVGQTKYISYISDETAYLVGLRQYIVRDDMTLCGTTEAGIFNELWKYEDTFEASVKGIYIACLSLCSILFVTIFIEIMLRLRSNEHEMKWLKRIAYLNMLLLFITFILYIISGAFGVRAKVDLNNDLKYLKILSKSQCFQQEVVNRILQVYQEYITEFWTLVWLSIVLLILGSAAIVLALILTLIDTFMEKRGGGGQNNSYYKNIGNSGRRNRPAAGVQKSGDIEMLLNR